MAHYVIRIYDRRRRGAYFVKINSFGDRYVFKGVRGAERFEREQDGLWVVITAHLIGRPVVEYVRDDGNAAEFAVTHRGKTYRVE